MNAMPVLVHPPAPATATGAAALQTAGLVLDSLDIALCSFDNANLTVLWNNAFLRFFPEHEGHVRMGEPYADNLRRFYRVRLSFAEMPHIERFVAEGITRHHSQSRPYSFDHCGRRLTAGSMPLPDGGRLRIWTARSLACSATPDPALAPLPDALFNVADGAAVLDGHGRLVAVNPDFVRLYDLSCAAEALGLTFGEVVRRAWERHASVEAPVALAWLDHARHPGAAFEVELPCGRWRRVIERHADDGSAYASHGDITALKQQQQALQDAYTKLEALAVTDSLTGIDNRRRFEQALLHAVQASARTVSPLSLLLVDVDDFKRINDKFGHPVGDGCLQRLASLLRRAVRVGDVAARLGGDEFALLLPGAGYADALDVAEMLRAAVAADLCGPGMTVSIGVASLDGAANEKAGPTLVAAADRALYAAKDSGRDRVCGPCVSRPLRA